jgi:2-keto-4-pentenoate hydratase
MTTTDQHERWAAELEAARAGSAPIAPLTDADPGLSVADAYTIARRGIDRRIAAGARVVGHKIGLTAVAVQEQLGVDEPDYGTLLDDMRVLDGGVVDAARFVAPRVELELAFHLAEPLVGPDVTAGDVQRATAFVSPAIEIADSRIADWRITLADTIADNASSGAFVLGGARVRPDELDLAAIDMALARDGDVIERGSSAAVLGDPRAAVAWLANALAAFGTHLRAGDIVLSGAGTRMAPARAGERFTGDFGGLGTVSVAFGAGA